MCKRCGWNTRLHGDRCNVCGAEDYMHSTQPAGKPPRTTEPPRLLCKAHGARPCAIRDNRKPVDPAPMRAKDAKDPWDLVPWGAMRQVVRVFKFGAEKHSPDGWRTAKDARRRYFAASMRHLNAWWLGETKDPESGLHPLAHVICCALILLALDE